MNGIKPIVRCLAVAFGGSVVLASFAYAQQTPAQPAQKQERIEVTGSNIKRVDTETVAPVQVITREEIEKSGKTTIADVLRDLPANQGNSYNETFTNSFSPGASGISLRGLGLKATLTLVNGRRMASYGFAQNLQDTYVDLNSIPTSAVERVEILKDGASAIYGADAVAGVVNIILRKDFRGLEAGLRAGTATEGGMNEYRGNLSFGAGDIGADKFNFFATLDVLSRDLLTADERDYTKSGDFRSRPGGGTLFTFGGTIVTGPTSRAALNPCPAGSNLDTNLRDDISQTFTAASTACTFNLVPYITLIPKTERIGFLSRGTFEVSPALSLFGELSLSKNTTEQTFSPAFVQGTVITANGGVRALPLIPSATNPVAATNPLLNGTRSLTYTFHEFGGRNAEIDTDAGRLLIGAKGALGNFDWEVGAGAARSETEQLNKNRLTVDVVSPAIRDGYNFLNPGSQPDLIALMKVDVTRKAESKLEFVDAKVSGEIATLPAGPLGIAAGIEHRREAIIDTPDPLVSQIKTISIGTSPPLSATAAAPFQAFNIVGQGSTATNGKRDSTSVFVEFSIPVLRGLEAQVAARYDNYSDFGNELSPKAGIKWTVNPAFVLRANYGEGFRAPTLPEISNSRATFFTTVFDPYAGFFRTIPGILGANPNLQPEQSKSYSVGAVIEPTKDFNIGMNAYEIKLSKSIIGNLSYAIEQCIAGNPAFADAVVRLDGLACTDPNTPGNSIVFAQDIWRNTDQQRVRGFDLDFRYQFPKSSVGNFVLSGDFAYLAKYKITRAPGLPLESVAGVNGSELTSSLPRLRSALTLNWSRGPWSTAVTQRYTKSTDQVNASTRNLLNALPPSPKVDSYDQTDLYVSYSGIKNLTLSASLLNAFDRKPPYDPAYTTGVDFTLYDLRGRFLAVGATYKFF
jgi:iron complex outermembrane receptor protein